MTVIIGGGAAGMMAAVTSARAGAHVTLLERNPRCGFKLNITGKGRCNVTNDCSPQELMNNITCNAKFLYSAFSKWTSADTMRFFEELGVPLKTERGSRVFPVSDNAHDITDALRAELRRCGVSVVQARAEEILTENGAVCGVRTADGTRLAAENVILATGGASYPRTGSDGDGYRMARALGHTVTPLRASLVPLTAAGDDCREMMGLSLRNVGLTVTENGKKIFSDFGELLFTHFGVSGPLALSASAHLRRWESRKYRLLLDLKPALSEEQLDRRVRGDFEKYGNSDFINSLGDLLPHKMIPVVTARTGIDPHLKCHSVTKEQRRALVSLLKSFPIELTGTRPIDEAVVTAGGVSVREVQPATMASKLVQGLYFAGEILDVDAYTGGFNLQIAWATGHAAGLAAAEGVRA